MRAEWRWGYGFVFFSSRRRHTRLQGDWSSDVCSSDLFTYEAKQTNGKYRSSGRSVVSKDGKTMTTTAKGTDADGKPMMLTLVYEKDSSEKSVGEFGLGQLAK